jgi:hypothetical protein
VFHNDPKEVAWRYFTSWFCFDLATSIPITYAGPVPDSFRCIACVRSVLQMNILEICRSTYIDGQVSQSDGLGGRLFCHTHGVRLRHSDSAFVHIDMPVYRMFVVMYLSRVFVRSHMFRGQAGASQLTPLSRVLRFLRYYRAIKLFRIVKLFHTLGGCVWVVKANLVHSSKQYYDIMHQDTSLASLNNASCVSWGISYMCCPSPCQV